MLQNRWNTSVATNVNAASAKATMRAFQPRMSAMPPPNSSRIVIGSSSPTIGIPALAMNPAVPA